MRKGYPGYSHEPFRATSGLSVAHRGCLVNYIGIDPGVTGAVAWLTEPGVTVEDMPANPQDLFTTLEPEPASQVKVIIEQPGLRPGGGIHSSFKIGQGFGRIEGVLASLGIPYVVVSPAKWKRHFNLIGKDKEASRALARSLWPSAPLERKKDHGRAEALLLAEYGRRMKL